MPFWVRWNHDADHPPWGVALAEEDLPPLDLHFPFRGYDWTELAEWLGIPLEKEGDDAADDELHRAILDRLWAYGTAGAQGARRFVRAVEREARKCNYEAPLWRGLWKIRSDAVFLGYLSVLLRHLWT